jgi:hypothetical protein
MRALHRVRLLAGLLLSLGFIAACSERAAHESALSDDVAPARAEGREAAPRAAIGPRQLIRTVSLELEVDDAAAARARAEKALQAVGGFVEGLDSAQYGGVRRVQLTLRAPKDKLDPLLSELRRLGRVQHEAQAVEDVTRKVVDADARLRNLQRTEERLLGLLTSSGSSLSDVLAVERELSRVREEHEVLSAELRALSEQVALSTIKLGLVQDSDPEPPPSLWSPFRRLARNTGNILGESFGALLGFISGLLGAILYALPWLPLGLAVVWLGRRLLAWRRQRRARGKQEPPT